MQEWEYKWFLVSLVRVSEKVEGKTVVRLRLEGADKVDELGRQGWELVSVQPFQSSFSGESWAGGPGGSEVSSCMLFFKRPKPKEGKGRREPLTYRLPLLIAKIVRTDFVGML